MTKKLTLWEKMFYRMNKELSGHNSLITTIKIHGEINEKIFAETVQALYKRHPRLKARMHDNEDEYFFELEANFSDIPVRFIEVGDENTFLKLQQTEFELPIDTNKYIWRAQCFRIKDQAIAYIVFSFSHAMVDGLSGYSIAKDFIKIANQNKIGLSEDINTLPLVSLADEELSSGGFNQKEQHTTEFRWPYQSLDTGIESRKTGNVILSLDTLELSNIRPILKERKLSVNDFLNGLLIKMIAEQKPHGMEQTVLHTPISLRTLGPTKIEAEQVLCATRLINTYHDLSGDTHDILANASAYQKQLIARIKQQDQLPPDEINTESHLEVYMQTSKKSRDAFFMGFCISNLGALNFETQASDPLQVQSFLFASNRRGSDCAMFINVSAYNDQLHFVFNYTEPMLQRAWVLSFAERFLQEICELNRTLRQAPTL